MRVEKANALRLVQQKSTSGENFVDDLQYKRAVHELDRHRIEAELDAIEHVEVMEMRTKWSFWILRSVLAIIVFDFLFIIAIGRGWLIYEADWVAPIFIGDSLLKVLGLAAIIVGWLFGKFKRGQG